MLFTARPCSTVLALTLTSLAPSCGWALDASCKAVGEAFKKSFGLPYHQVITRSEDGKPSRSEVIYDGTSVYLQVHGQWIAAGAMDNPFQDLMNEHDGRQHTCSRVREQPWEGQPATVYQVNSLEDGQLQQGEVWISQTGLLVHMLNNDSEHFELRMEYVNIKAPASAKKLGS